ncbi:MAG: hypothetical protein ABFR02_01610 [Campylobacterota bacterium]
MKTVLKYLSLFIVTPVILTLVLLFSPAVTKALTQKALSHFLEVDADVTQARLSLQGFRSSGTLNAKDTFTLLLTPTSWTSATVKLHYDGNVNTFSNVATVELPYIAAVLDAEFTTDNLLLKLNATLLNGTLTGELSLEEWNYHYEIDSVDLTSFRTQQNDPLPNYATGQLSAKGSGIIEAPYTVGFFLQSQELQLEKSATTLISPELEHPLALALEINGSVGAENLSSSLTLKSRFIDADFSNLFYDFNQSTFNVELDIINHQEKIAPLKHAALDLNGSIGKNDLNASYHITVDDYTLRTKRMQFDLNTSDLALDYKLTSKKTKPLNLQDDYALFGDVSYGNDNLSASMDSKALNSPVLLSLKANQLHLISNNMPLEIVQKMADQEVIAQGDLFLEADANLSSEPLLWHAKVQSKNLKLPWRYRKDVGLKNDLALTVKANSEKNGDIVVRPTLWSNVAIVNYSALRYKPDAQLLFFNFNAKKIKTAHYQAPKLNIKGSLNLKKSRLNKTTLTTPYEKVVINKLHYSGQGVKSKVDFAVTRLDRFAGLNPDYTLSGKTFVDYTPQKTTIELESKELGSISFESRKKVIKMSGNGLPVEEVMRLTDQPVIMKGALAYNIRYSPSSINVMVNSDKLSGYRDLSASVRPFSLKHDMSLNYKDDRYRGHATVKTDNETINVSNVVFDLSKKQFKSHYKLNIKALEKNTFILPKELKGPLLIHGDFIQNEYQHLTINLLDFQLPEEWHKKLDANATSHLETNASIQAYNDKGLVSFDADVTNRLLQLKLHKSNYNLKTGDFHLKSDLKTELWLKDTNLTAVGQYQKESLYLSKADMTAAHETATLQNLRYMFKEQNLTAAYQLQLRPYPDAPYHSKASIYGEVRTKPELYATMTSDSLGGEFNAYVTNTDLHLTAKSVSVPKLVAFSGQKVPIADGSLDAVINISSPSLLEGNLSTIRGRSDINITNMLLEGVVLDDSLKTLRDSQDLNLFQGSLTELPIIRSIKEIPSDLTKEATTGTRFREIRLLTDINNSILHCVDCAIATEKNLIAVKGDINLDSRTFNAFYIGLLFPTNCAYYIQQVEGNLSEPQVQLAAAGFNVVGGATKSLLGNIGSALDLGADIVKGTGSVVGEAASYVPVVGERTDKALTRVTDAPKDITAQATECTPFYTGVVKHPEQIHKSRLDKTIERMEQRQVDREERKAK